MSGNFFGCDTVGVPPIVIKLAVIAAADKRTWKTVAALIAAGFVPIIVAVINNNWSVVFGREKCE